MLLDEAQKFDVCLTADRAYAAPTAVTARVISKRRSEGVRNVFFVWVEDDEPLKELRVFLDAAEVEFVKMPKNLIAQLGAHSLYHIPSTTLARLFLAEILSQFSIGKFLYLDGDVDLIAPLTPLMNVELTEAEFAAVGIRDEMNLNYTVDPNSEWGNHLRKLGIEQEQGYFNAGVVLADMHGFATLGEMAFDFYLKNREICRYLDQDALNAVCGGRRKKLSPRFNFQKSLFNLGLEQELTPAIVHFNSFWKPWRPTPFTRTWQSRRVFFESWSDLKSLWPDTWPLSQPWSSTLSYHSSALMSELKGRQKNSVRRQDILAYIEATVFVDTR